MTSTRQSVRVRTLLLCGVATALLTPAMALAQSAPPAETVVDELIVTTQRREERLQDVPVAITAFSANQLEERGVSNTRQLEQVTPGLNFSQSIQSPQPTIRGIGGRGVNIGDEATVPLYIDGIYQPSLVGSVLELNSIERVEVVKGPQGALLGRNATGGAINIITRAPTGGFRAKAEVSYGSFEEKILKGYVGGGSDTFAADLAMLWRDDEGYVYNAFLKKNTADSDAWNVRTKLRFTPNDIFDATLTLSASESHDAAGLSYHVLNGNTVGRRIDPTVPIPNDTYTISTNEDGDSEFRQYAASLTLVGRFESFTITSLTSMQLNKEGLRSDSEGTSVDANILYNSRQSEPALQEIYAVSNGDGPFSWIVGGVYFFDSARSRPNVIISRNPVTGVRTTTSSTPNTSTTAYAAYAQGRFAFSDQWAITLGGRYTSENRTRGGRIGGAPASGDQTFEKFTPQATLEFKPSENLNFYLKAGQAFKSGLFNASNASQPAVDPELVVQYELGMKANPWRGVYINAAIYKTEYEDLQVNSRNAAGAGQLLNAASAEIWGGELEILARPTDKLQLNFGLAVIDAEYTDFPGASVTVPNGLGGNSTVFIDATGNTLIRAPKHSLTLGGSYHWDVFGGDLRASGNLNYQSKQYWEISNRIVAPERTLVNAELAWTDSRDRFTIALWGENLLDEAYHLSFLTSGSADSVMYARPRSVGVRLSVSWD